MDSTLNDKVAEGRLTSLEQQLLNLAREAGVSPSGPPIGLKPLRPPLATIHQLADWRLLAFVGAVLAASIGGAAWWWMSSADPAIMPPSKSTPLTQAGPKDVAPTAVAPSSDLAQQLQPMARDLAALRQVVEQLQVRQEQLVRDNENVASQLKASQAETARNNNIIDQIKATQIQVARESATVTERLNASQEQLARVLANASEPRVVPEEPRVMPEEPGVMTEGAKVSPEQPRAISEVPLPRPRRSTNVAQAHKPAPPPARPRTNKPQPSAFPWSVR
ncbi:hypothetical protein [Bradyrhizobium septentrionale]|uniref:Uncharacterized protein n=1 Tax=Bradyrhizobium septentrionale TaxID=1404411 RepID=A0A973W1T8_9BRAD|nr:hypothetical protein [Bradyrhizobium septentrionale]UGY14650.1 hypothetical protein HAP48_0039910 [Bradyrhizobium septentrionale]UGY23224.1 hypothetical protein HU675_0035495 [Bradyrhizobium septentrionale]